MKGEKVELSRDEVRTVGKLCHYFLVLRSMKVFDGREAQKVEALDRRLKDNTR